MNESVNSSSQLTSSQLGGIIGGCAAALVLILISLGLICFRRRHKRKEEFISGIGVSSYNVAPPPQRPPPPQPIRTPAPVIERKVSMKQHKGKL